jgi:hypothetical protein
MTGENGLGELLESHIGGVVLIHVDLFDDYLSFGVDLVDPERRPLQHLREQIEADPEISVQQPGPETGVVLGREGV